MLAQKNRPQEATKEFLKYNALIMELVNIA